MKGTGKMILVGAPFFMILGLVVGCGGSSTSQSDSAAKAAAQQVQVTGELGSPSATTTIEMRCAHESPVTRPCN